MSDVIQLLPDTVANQIAAGEVIQRPASVIKELVENAVDAGASSIDIVVRDAGRTEIQVIDNGTGMSETDARLAFERHATSKIRKAADLFSLQTMGFRGEALPSIAAVAQVRLRTRRADDEVGTQLLIEGSHFVEQQPCSCPVGSNFTVDNLFYNVPARRKFLKSNTTELNNIIVAFQRIALVCPGISFTLRSNNAELFNLRSCGLKQRIVDVFGKKISAMLLPINVDTTLCKIHGFVGKPESARKKGAHQYFFVNGRYMKHFYFNKAVASAFDRLVSEGEQVPYFIYFEVPPENIDVNIHPTKTEIKFENEQAIWQILSAAVKESLGLFNNIPTIDFDTRECPYIPVFGQNDSVEMPEVPFDVRYDPFEKDTSQRQKKQTSENWEKLYEAVRQNDGSEGMLFPASQQGGEALQEDDMTADKSPTHYQYKGRYIMVAVKSGLMIIDQHRAHVRVLYDTYMSKADGKKLYPQKVMFPETIHFTRSESLGFQKIEREMAALGFELSSLGGGTYVINSVPAGLEGVNHIELVRDMTLAAIEKRSSALDEINQTLALNMASHAAIAYGQVLGNDEMAALVDNLFACKNFNYTPNGKRILCILKQTEIENLLA